MDRFYSVGIDSKSDGMSAIIQIAAGLLESVTIEDIAFAIEMQSYILWRVIQGIG